MLLPLRLETKFGTISSDEWGTLKTNSFCLESLPLELNGSNFLGVEEIWSSVSNNNWSSPISLCLGMSFSKKVTSRDSNSITLPLSCLPMKTYSFDYSLYVIKTVLFPLRPNFPYL